MLSDTDPHRGMGGIDFLCWHWGGSASLLHHTSLWQSSSCQACHLYKPSPWPFWPPHGPTGLGWLSGRGGRVVGGMGAHQAQWRVVNADCPRQSTGHAVGGVSSYALNVLHLCLSPGVLLTFAIMEIMAFSMFSHGNLIDSQLQANL